MKGADARSKSQADRQQGSVSSVYHARSGLTAAMFLNPRLTPYPVILFFSASHTAGVFLKYE